MTFDGLERNHFGVILADPPWHFKTYSAKGRDRCPDKYYTPMSTRDIMDLPVADLAAPDCALFLWTTWPMLLDAISVIGAWGFRYKTCAFDWMKARVVGDSVNVSMGTGHWTRANSEPCLLATRGRPKRRSAAVRMGIVEPRREHSRKPDCVHGRIRQLVDGPYLELFGRQQRAGWTVWGNEPTKFREAAE